MTSLKYKAPIIFVSVRAWHVSSICNLRRVPAHRCREGIKLAWVASSQHTAEIGGLTTPQNGKDEHHDDFERGG